LSYVLPRGCGTDECVLGGTHETGIENLDSPQSEQNEIYGRCQKICNKIGALALSDRQYDSWVGVRPERDTVRVTLDEKDSRIIHNYGHGGSGITLHWGCAESVSLLRMVREAHGALVSSKL